MFFPLYGKLPTKRPPLTTYSLVAANVLVFLWMSRLPSLPREVLAYEWGFVPARITQIDQSTPVYAPIDLIVQDQFWSDRVERRAIKLDAAPPQVCMSLITCMFLHGSWVHLLGNMWFLWLFGNNVEDRLGPLPYLSLYFAGGMIASFTHWAIAPNDLTPVIGASGAIAAILGAYAITWPWARVSTLVFLLFFFTIIEIPALLVLGAWFIVQVIAGHGLLRSPTEHVAWWAHVGGFLAGMALMPPLSALVRHWRRQDEGKDEGMTPTGSATQAFA